MSSRGWEQRAIQTALTSCFWGHVTALICPDLYRCVEICVLQLLLCPGSFLAT